MTTYLHERVLAERPDLRGSLFAPERMNVAFIGDEVFKGPLTESMEYLVENEIAALRLLEDVDLPVPRITYVGKKSTFFGMTRLPGIRLSSVDRMPALSMQALAEDIAGFCLKLTQALSMKEGRYVIQGDMHEGNILVDPDTARLTGIVDFEQLKIYPREELPDRVAQLIGKDGLRKAVTRRMDELPQNGYTASSEKRNEKDELLRDDAPRREPVEQREPLYRFQRH